MVLKVLPKVAKFIATKPPKWLAKEALPCKNVSIFNDKFSIRIDQTEENLVKEVEVLGCLDCMGSNMACAVPTLMKGLDDQSAEEGE